MKTAIPSSHDHHHMAKGFWAPEHHSHMWAVPNLLQQCLMHTTAKNVFICCRIKVFLSWNYEAKPKQLTCLQSEIHKVMCQG